MAQTRVAINGFGRIGRLTFKDLLDNEQVDVVAINDLTDTHTLAHLLKYDTAHGHFDREVKVHDDGLEVDGRVIKVTAIKDPAELPWSTTEVDVVLESMPEPRRWCFQLLLRVRTFPRLYRA